MAIYMERVEGRTAKEWLLGEPSLEKRQEVARAIGRRVGELHDAGIVHGDLTTSNMIVREPRGGKSEGGSGGGGGIALIDFGLGAQAVKNPEDKAVDLYVLERALASMHANSDTELMPHVLASVQGGFRQEALSGHAEAGPGQERGRKRLPLVSVISNS